MPTYSHTQKQPLWAFIVPALIALVLLFLCGVLGLPLYATISVFVGLLLVLATLLLWNRSLTVEVTDSAVTWQFSTKNSMGVALADIASVEIVQYSPFTDLLRSYSILGTFYSLKYDAPAYALNLYFLSKPFIKVTRKNNSAVLIGTDDPQGLLNAIQTGLAAGSHVVTPLGSISATPPTGKRIRSDVVVMMILLAIGLVLLLSIMWWGFKTP